jgi:hypothetical protein
MLRLYLNLYYLDVYVIIDVIFILQNMLYIIVILLLYYDEFIILIYGLDFVMNFMHYLGIMAIFI